MCFVVALQHQLSENADRVESAEACSFFDTKPKDG